MSKTTIRIIMAICIILIGIFVFISIKNKPAADLPKAITINTQGQPFIGNAKSPIKVVIFEDLKCISCMQFNVDELPQIKKDFIDNGKVKYTIVTLAFIPGSMPAANASLCIDQQNSKQFFPFVEYIYNHQGDESTDWATIPTLLSFADKVGGIDTEKLSKCLISARFNNQISKNFNLAKKVMGETVSTPSVYINGTQVIPATYKQFKTVYEAIK